MRDLEQLKATGEILLAAAHADGRFQPEEEGEIRRLLCEELASDTLPTELVAHLDSFEPDTFELADACDRLRLFDPDDRRWILLLVARVTEVDEVHDLDESHFIRRLARCIGAEPEEYAALTVETSTGPEGTPVPPPKPR